MDCVLIVVILILVSISAGLEKAFPKTGRGQSRGRFDE